MFLHGISYKYTTLIVDSPNTDLNKHEMSMGLRSVFDESTIDTCGVFLLESPSCTSEVLVSRFSREIPFSQSPDPLFLSFNMDLP